MIINYEFRSQQITKNLGINKLQVFFNNTDFDR
jgi:hypothetical protein